MRFNIFCFAWALFTCTALPSAYGIHSAVISAGAHDAESGQGQFDDQLGFTTASAQYGNPNGGSASGIASITRGLGGGFSMKAFATATGGSGEGEFVSNRGYAYASWDDALRFRGTPVDALMMFQFSFTGSQSGDTLGSAGYTVTDANGNFVIGAEQTHTGELTFGIESEFSEPTTYQINVSLSASATGHGSGLGGPTTSTADYSHSLTLMSITPLDADGNYIPGVTIESDSGFDYNALIQNVPEPSAAALVAIGCTALVCRRNRGDCRLAAT